VSDPAEAGRRRELAHNPVVMRRAGGFDVDFRPKRFLEKPTQNLLVFLRRNLFLCGNLHPAADGHKTENMEGVNAEVKCHFKNLGEKINIVAGDCGVYLGAHSRGLNSPQTRNGGIEAPRQTAEAVVNGGCGTVEANADPSDAGLLDFLRHILVDQGSIRGQGDSEAFTCGMGGYVEDVAAIKRFTAAEDEKWRESGRKLVKKSKGLLRR